MNEFQTERLHALDAARGAALLLGIVLHATLSFFPGDPVWLIMDTQRSGVLSTGFYVIHIFRMTAFFLLAGFFGHMSCHRMGAGGFLKDRLKRIGGPLAIGWPLMMMAFTGLIVWIVIIQNGGTMPENPPPPPPITWETLPLTHLWFLYVLLIFYGGMLALRGVISVVDRQQNLARLADKTMTLLFATPAAALVLALPTGLILLFHEGWLHWFGIPTPDYGIRPNTPSLAIYGMAFIIGWLLHRQRGLIQNLRKHWLIYALAAFVLIIVSRIQAGSTPLLVPRSFDWSITIYAASYALAIWATTFAFIGSALRFFSSHSPVRRYLADSSYWLYIIHLPIVIALQIWMAGWDIHWACKYSLILAISLPVMLISYHFLVRNTFIGILLHGKKQGVGKTQERSIAND